MKIKTIKQNDLTSDCWTIQIFGISACEKCEYKNKKRFCGGMRIRKEIESGNYPKNGKGEERK
jgi:hypothetical protein